MLTGVTLRERLLVISPLSSFFNAFFRRYRIKLFRSGFAYVEYRPSHNTLNENMWLTSCTTKPSPEVNQIAIILDPFSRRKLSPRENVCDVFVIRNNYFAKHSLARKYFIRLY